MQLQDRYVGYFGPEFDLNEAVLRPCHFFRSRLVHHTSNRVPRVQK